MRVLLVTSLLLGLIGLIPCLADQDGSDAAKLASLQTLKGWQPSSGNPVLHLDSTGGPDTFGYTWIDSDETGGPTYSWIDITGTGTEVAAADGLGDDDRVGPYPIGFLFPFYGYGEEYFWVQSNGAVSFFANPLPLGNQQMPYIWYDGMVALFWDDLDPGDGAYGNVYYDTVVYRERNVCVVSFVDYAEYQGGPDQDRIDMQVLLFDDGLIRIQYQSIDAGFDCTSCTIGIQTHGGTDGLTYVYNDISGNYPFAGLAVDFVPPESSASLSGIVYLDGTGNPLAGANVRVGCGQTVSDNSGNYTVSGVYPGTYPLIVWKTGYDAINTVTTLAAGNNVLHYNLYPSPTPVTGPFTDNFEGGGTPLFQGWGEWEFGTPAYMPNGAYSGSNAWSTDLDSDYENDQDDWLKSQKGFVVQNNYSLKYYHWYDYDGGSDGYNVWISTTAGAFWTQIFPEGGYGDPDGFYTANGLPCFNNWGNDEQTWTQKRFPLNNYVGQTVWFAFRHTTDSAVVYSGVSIDNLQFNTGGIAPTVVLQLWPVMTNIPSYGGTLVYDAGITSTFNQVITGQAWTKVMLPNGSMYGPLMLATVNIPPGYIFIGNLTQLIPAYAPPGPYVFYGYLGMYPNYVATSDNFPFVKTVVPGPDGEPVTEWKAEKWVISAAPAGGSAELPDQYGMDRIWPNPFNATAQVTVQLPASSELTLRVFNIEGREVARLAQGYYPAGAHRFAFDGSSLASGVYFIQAAVPGERRLVQKVTLLK